MNEYREDSLRNPLAFFDISDMARGVSSPGHGHSFHENLRLAATQAFLSASVLGPVSERSSSIEGLISSPRFRSGLFGFFPKLWVGSDLKRISAYLDSLEGVKVLHFYEGGFRELLLLAKLLSKREDSVAVFNFFFLEEWTHFLTSQDKTMIRLRSAVSKVLSALEGNVLFFSDTPDSAKLVLEALSLSRVDTYPLFSSGSQTRQTLKRLADRKYTLLFSPRSRAEASLVVESLRLIQSTWTQRTSVAILPRWGSVFDTPKSLESNPNLDIHVFNGELAEAEYNALFVNTKIVALPYLDDHYQMGSSGKMLDAVQAGCHLIVPRGLAGNISQSGQALGMEFDGSASSLVQIASRLVLEDEPILGGDPLTPAQSVEVLGAGLSSLSRPKKVETPTWPLAVTAALLAPRTFLNRAAKVPDYVYGVLTRTKSRTKRSGEKKGKL